eukprot:5694804-Pyramimonas_sp.AAC.1
MKPSRHLRIRFSRQFFTDTVRVRVKPAFLPRGTPHLAPRDASQHQANDRPDERGCAALRRTFCTITGFRSPLDTFPHPCMRFAP